MLFSTKPLLPPNQKGSCTGKIQCWQAKQAGRHLSYSQGKKMGLVEAELGANERDRIFYGFHCDYDWGLWLSQQLPLHCPNIHSAPNHQRLFRNTKVLCVHQQHTYTLIWMQAHRHINIQKSREKKALWIQRNKHTQHRWIRMMNLIY